MRNEEPLCTVIPEDRGKAVYLLEHRGAEDGANHVIVRKKTWKGQLIWVDLHYSIFEYGGWREEVIRGDRPDAGDPLRL